MDGKIKKCKKDLLSLHETLSNLKQRNDSLKGHLIVKKTGDLDKANKEQLEDKVIKVNEEMFAKKKELDRLNAELVNNDIKLREKDEEVNFCLILDESC
jgi:uncharacterized protein (DUF342 family)